VRDRPDVIAGMPLGGSPTASGRRSCSLVFAPLIGKDGETLGLLNPADPLHGPFPGPRETRLLETLAELIVVGLEIVRARAVERASVAVAQAQRRQLEDLLAASAQVRGYYSLDEVLREIARAMTTARGFRRAAVYLRMPDDDLVVGATVGLSEAESKQLRETPLTLQEFAGAMRPEMLLSRSYFLDHRRFEIPPELAEKLNTAVSDRQWMDGQWHPDDMLIVKIAGADGDLLGLISVDEPVNGLAHRPGPCSGDRVLRRPVRRGGHHRAPVRRSEGGGADGLADRTREPARAGRRRGSRRSARDAALGTVLFIDIDHFKDINDALGHAVGDAVLQGVGAGLRDRLRRGDLLARYGGEEFVALLADTDLAAALQVAEVLRSRIASLDFNSLTGELPVRVFIGVAQLSEELMGTGSLLAAADAAMYEAKRQGRNRVVFAP